MDTLYHKKTINQNYFGIFPKFGGTINLWFDSTIGSFSHLHEHPATTQTTDNSAKNKAIFFIYLFLSLIIGAKKIRPIFIIMVI